MMIRSIGLALVAVTMSMQLMFLPTRSMIFTPYGKDMPWMRLPVAEHITRSHCDGRMHETLSWTKSGGWVGRSGNVAPRDIEALLRKRVEQSEENGRRLTLHLRIPADAKAGHFMVVAMAAQRAGVSGLNLAVWRDEPIRLR